MHTTLNVAFYTRNILLLKEVPFSGFRLRTILSNYEIKDAAQRGFEKKLRMDTWLF